MKKIFIFIFAIASLAASAQTKTTATKPAVPEYTVKTDVEKMARDYYAHFYYTKGEKISDNESAVVYECKVKPKDAVSSTITQYKSTKDDYSWEADMLNTEDFTKASAKYKQIYSQLSGSSFAMHDGKTYKIKGDYDAPEESRGMASSFLQLDVKDKALRKLKIEVSLNYDITTWSVKLLIYEKDDDKDIKPEQKKEDN